MASASEVRRKVADKPAEMSQLPSMLSKNKLCLPQYEGCVLTPATLQHHAYFVFEYHAMPQDAQESTDGRRADGLVQDLSRPT